MLKQSSGLSRFLSDFACVVKHSIMKCGIVFVLLRTAEYYSLLFFVFVSFGHG